MENQLLLIPQFKFLEREGKFILIDPLSPNWIGTNQVGFDLIRQIDGKSTFNEIVDRAANSGICSSKKQEIIKYLNDLLQEDFIKTQPDIKPDYPGRAGAISPGNLDEVWIYTNNNCNFNCCHCLVSENKNNEIIPYEKLTKIIDESLKLKAKRFFFTGGEPFLRKDIFEVIEYVTSRAQLIILTNGSLLNKENINKLSKFKDKLVLQISLEGSKAEINDRIRGEGSFQKTTSILRNLIKTGLSPIVSTTITKNNITDLQNITKMLDSLGVKTHHLIWFHLRGQGMKNFDELFVEGKKLAIAMLELFSFSKELDIEVDNETWLKARLASKKNRKSDLCNSGWEMLSVGTDGNLYPCPALNGDSDFSCGSVFDDSLSRAWLDSDKANWIRENTVDKKVGCNDCYLKFLCGGGCYCQAYYSYKSKTGTGCIMAPDPYCEAYKLLSEEILFGLCENGNGSLNSNKPILLGAMAKQASACSASTSKVINGAFEVSTFHCSCVMKN